MDEADEADEADEPEEAEGEPAARNKTPNESQKKRTKTHNEKKAISEPPAEAMFFLDPVKLCETLSTLGNFETPFVFRS